MGGEDMSYQPEHMSEAVFPRRGLEQLACPTAAIAKTVVLVSSRSKLPEKQSNKMGEVREWRIHFRTDPKGGRTRGRLIPPIRWKIREQMPKLAKARFE